MESDSLYSLCALPEYWYYLWLCLLLGKATVTNRQRCRQASVFAKALLGIYSFLHRVVVGIGCAFTTCNYMVPFIPKDF